MSKGSVVADSWRAEEELRELGYEPQLRRQLGMGSLLVYGLLFFVPLAPVAVFGIVAHRSGGVPVTAYVAAAIVMGLSASSYREMALRFATAGSTYGYVRLAVGPFWGFVAGWMILLDYLLMPSLLVVLGSVALAHSLPGVPVVVFAAAFVAASLLLNYAGITLTTRVGVVLLAIQLAVIVAFAGFVGAAVVAGRVSSSWSPWWHAGAHPAAVFSALSVAALSYLGFDAVATLNEEAKGGGRAVARATVALLALITGLFVLQTWGAALVVPAGADPESAFYAAVDAVAPHWFSVVFTLANAFVAIFACLVVAHASTARLLFAMGRDGTLPRFLGRTTDSGVPRPAVWVTGALALVLAVALADHADVAASLVTFGALSSYVVLHGAVVVRCFLRDRSRRVGRHLLIPAAGAVLLVVALLRTEWLTRAVGLSWLALGLAGYVVVRLVHHRRRAVEQQA